MRKENNLAWPFPGAHRVRDEPALGHATHVAGREPPPYLR
jgi:hypothetical protein